jgi:hypothetical protein
VAQLQRGQATLLEPARGMAQAQAGALENDHGDAGRSP